MSGTTLWRSVAALPLFIAWLMVPSVARAEPRHPHMQNALYELKEARLELKQAAHDFGGHREAALKAVDTAIAQIEIALGAVGEKVTDVTVDRESYRKYDYHPHINRSIYELREVRAELKDARHDFGGHRADALRDVNYAIDQLEVCLRYARK